MKAEKVNESKYKSKIHEEIPIFLTGIVYPSLKTINCNSQTKYKLVTKNMSDFFIITNHEWEEVLKNCLWKKIKVRGLVNVDNRTIFPKRIDFDNPKGGLLSVCDILKVPSSFWSPKLWFQNDKVRTVA